MDDHYNQVQRARAAQAGQPPRLYFAYSTILDRAAFEEWRAQHGYNEFELPSGQIAEAIDVDLVFDFPSRWWGGRVAGLVDAPSKSVFGRLYEIAGTDWPIVQHKEGAVTGMCVERPVQVRIGDRVLAAEAFTTAPARRSFDGPVSARFLEALRRGAVQAELPAAYRAHLDSLA